MVKTVKFFGSGIIDCDDLIELCFAWNFSDFSITPLHMQPSVLHYPHDWHASKLVPQGLSILPLMDQILLRVCLFAL